MKRSLVEIAYNKHKDWIKIVKSFGCNSSVAEDIVQEMYIQLHLDVQKGLDLWYGEEVNTYYCYKVLRGIYLNIYKKEAKQIKMYLEDINELKQAEELGIDEVEYAKRKGKIDDILNQMFWYDRKVFEICASGKSVAKLSRDTNISYYSLYNTYTNAKKFIKDQL
jgi:DNA-directed RNA polymerase specialized sigma24 family protein